MSSCVLLGAGCASGSRPMRRRGYHPPINVRLFNISRRKRQALSSSIPVRATSNSCCPKARRFATARSWARTHRLGPAWPRSAARKNGRDERRPSVRSGGSARSPIMSKAVRTIRWVRARYTFTPAARTRCSGCSPMKSRVRSILAGSCRGSEFTAKNGRKCGSRNPSASNGLFLLVVVFGLGLLLLLHDRLIATGGDGRSCRLLFFGQFQPGLSHVG
jgi:hypothetical protein